MFVDVHPIEWPASFADAATADDKTGQRKSVPERVSSKYSQRERISRLISKRGEKATKNKTKRR